MNTTEIILMSAAIYFLCCQEQNQTSMGKIRNFNVPPGPNRYNVYNMGYAGAAGLGRFPSQGPRPYPTPFFKNSPDRFPGVAGYLPQGSSPTAEMAYNKPPAYYWKTQVRPTNYNGYGRSVYPRYYSVSKLKI